MSESEKGLSNSEIELAIRATNRAISAIDTSVPRKHPPTLEEQVAEWEGMMRAYHHVLHRDLKTTQLLNSHLPGDV